LTLQHKPPNPILQDAHVEIDEQSKLVAGHPQISQNDRLVNGTQSIHGFQFHNDPSLNKKIETIAAFQLRIFVHYWDSFLALDSKVSKVKLVRETFLVRRLEQSWTEMLMDLNRCSDYFVSDFVIGHFESGKEFTTEVTEVTEKTRREETT
jgi:hypothetical protein